MTTRIYFDVDGVFNALPYRKTDLPAETGWQTWERVEVNGYTITYSPELVAAVNEIAAREDTDVRWLTTWCHDAAELLAPALGLEGINWPVLGTPADIHHLYGTWWKFNLIRDELAEVTEAVVWVDDDMLGAAYQVEDMLPWTKEREHLLQICPKSEHGVTKSHVEEIVEFLDRVQAIPTVV